MATLKQLRQEAAKHGADLDIDRDFGSATAWLKDCFAWVNTSAACAAVNYGYKGMMPEVYDDLIELMRDGAESA